MNTQKLFAIDFSTSSMVTFCSATVFRQRSSNAHIPEHLKKHEVLVASAAAG